VLEALQAVGQTGEIVASLAATIGIVVAALVTFDSLGVAGYLVFDVTTGRLSLVPLEENAHISMVQRYGRAQMAPDWQVLEDALQRLHPLDERGIHQLVEHRQTASTQSTPPVLLEPTVTTEPFQRGFVRYQLVGNADDFAALSSADAGAQVYVFRDAQGRAIYVGSTERSSVVRLREHLAKDRPGEFLGEASFIEVKGKGLLEREALALEQDLIQELKPKYNHDPAPYSRKYRGELPSWDEIRRANSTLIRIGIKFAD
jgi:GIY-YIG catalytic domain